MIICANCKRELRCLKNGVGADYGCGHVYPGDLYICDSCGTKVLSTVGKPIFDPKYKTQDAYIKMSKGDL